MTGVYGIDVTIAAPLGSYGPWISPTFRNHWMSPSEITKRSSKKWTMRSLQRKCGTWCVLTLRWTYEIQDGQDVYKFTGWWFGPWILCSISYMGCHPSHWLIFFKMVETTNQYMLDIGDKHLYKIHIVISKKNHILLGVPNLRRCPIYQPLFFTHEVTNPPRAPVSFWGSRIQIFRMESSLRCEFCRTKFCCCKLIGSQIVPIVV